MPALRLALGKLKGAPTSHILYKLNAKPSVLGYFSWRYYPQNKAQILPSTVNQADDPRGVVQLHRYLRLCFTIAISKTSSLAIVRAKICRRLKAALRSEFANHGLDALPSQPMILVISPNMSAFRAPFPQLREDVWQTYEQARKEFEALSMRKRAAITPRQRLVDLEPGRKRRPDLRGDGKSKEIIAETLKNLPKSSYMKQFGDPKELFARMKAVLHNEKI